MKIKKFMPNPTTQTPKLINHKKNSSNFQELTRISPKYVDNENFRKTICQSFNYKTENSLKNNRASLSIDQIKNRFTEIIGRKGFQGGINRQKDKIKMFRSYKNQKAVPFRITTLKDTSQKSSRKIKQFLASKSQQQWHSPLYYKMVETLAKNNSVTYSYSHSLDYKYVGQHASGSKKLRQGCNPYSPDAREHKKVLRNSFEKIQFLNKQKVFLQNDGHKYLDSSTPQKIEKQQNKSNQKDKEAPSEDCLLRTESFQRISSDDKNFRATFSNQKSIFQNSTLLNKNSFCYNYAMSEKPTKFWKQKVPINNSNKNPGKKIFIMKNPSTMNRKHLRTPSKEHKMWLNEGLQPWEKQYDQELNNIQILDAFGN